MNTGDKYVPPLRIAVGIDNFKALSTDYDIFVDKTLFIKEIIETSDTALLITYPRRWGKSLNLDMLKTFFEPESEECNRNQTNCNKDIFTSEENLAIATVDNGIHLKEQGKYPVIFISLKDVKGDTIEEIESRLKDVVTSLYQKYRHLDSSSILHDSEKKIFSRYIEQDYNSSPNILLGNGIKYLSELLHKHHKEKVYVLVDEYDKPVHSFLENYLEQENLEHEILITRVAKLITDTVCSPVAKTNPALKKLILTGIFDTIHREENSGCNNVSPYGIYDKKFSQHFGFSAEEVENLTSSLSFDNENRVLETIKMWYDGYYVPIKSNEAQYGDVQDNYIQVYTPWAVMKYLNKGYSERDLMPENYWAQSSVGNILERLLTKEKCLKSDLGDKLSNITQEGVSVLQFDSRTSILKYDQFRGADNEKFYSYLLLNSGYLTAQKISGKYHFSIPNKEVQSEFIKSTPQDSGEQCNTIVSNLKKNMQLKLIELIRQKDVEGIKRELDGSDISCKDDNMNLSFLHLAAIFGDQDVFQLLLDSKCKKQLLTVDQLFQLKTADYAFMLGKGDVIQLITQYNYKNKESIYVLEKSQVCASDYSVQYGVGITAVTLWLKSYVSPVVSNLIKNIKYPGSDLVQSVTLGTVEELAITIAMKVGQKVSKASIEKLIIKVGEGANQELMSQGKILGKSFAGGELRISSIGSVQHVVRSNMWDKVLFIVDGLVQLSLFGISSYITTSAIKFMHDDCSKDSRYRDINIDGDLNSLEQFKKYTLEHDDAYVVVDAPCKPGEQIASLNLSNI